MDGEPLKTLVHIFYPQGRRKKNLIKHKTKVIKYSSLGWIDIGFRLEIKLGYTGTPITLTKMTLNEIYSVTFFARLFCYRAAKNSTLVKSKR